MKGFNPPVTPAKIVQDNWRFSIPIYQRLFVWEREQIDRLLDDLWTASEKNKDQPYYIGVITTVEQSDRDNGRVFSVVDGQQRLTFLLLFFCDCIARGEKMESARKFVSLNRDLNESQLRIRFLGRKFDEEDIRLYIRHSENENEKWDSVRNLNFRQFHDRMEVFIKKHKDWESKNEAFVKYVFEKTSFLVNELAGFSNADLNLYFEKMNSTGRQLSPLEQLKGEFASYASDWNDCFNFEISRCESEAKRNPASEKSDSCTSTIDQDGLSADGKDISLDAIVKYTGEVEDEPKQGQVTSTFSRLPMRPEVLALHALRLTLGKDDVDLSPRHLLETFNKKMSNDPAVRENYIAYLKTYRDWLDQNIIYLRGEMEADSEESADTSGLKYDFRDQQKSSDKKMLQLQSMLYVSSGEKQEWVLEAYKAFKDKDGKLDFGRLRQYALNRLDKNNVFELTYSPGMNRLAFWILDYLLWEKVVETEPQQEHVTISFCEGVAQELSKDQIAAIKRYRFTQNRSVEHLHPQNPPAESDAWNDDRNNNGDKVRNSFGNLCMISQSTNSELSNEPVGVKFAKVTENLRKYPLQSIKLMLMFVCCNRENDSWTPERAIEHGGEMLKILGFNETSIENWKASINPNTEQKAGQ